MRALAVVALAVLGGFVGWVIATSAAPSNGELRKAAVQLVPNRTWLEEVVLVDRPASLSNPLWDIGGDRYAEAVLTPPGSVDEEAVQEAVRRGAAATGWSRTGTTDAGGPLYRRSNLEATVEASADEPGVGVQAAIRVRPRSFGLAAAALLGAVCGAVAGLLVVYLLGRRRASR
ncbi:MAG TPA: hypothetical protein VF063_05425 [Gaiellaceae bacterium]